MVSVLSSAPPGVIQKDAGDLTDDLGHWSMVARVMTRLGATKVGCNGPMFSCKFREFTLEARIYQSRSVAAVTSSKKTGKNGERLAEIFTLSDAITEPRAVSIELSQLIRVPTSEAQIDETPGVSDIIPIADSQMIDVTFIPVPEFQGQINQLELARRYVIGLAAMLEKAAPQILRKYNDPIDQILTIGGTSTMSPRSHQ
jgi:hypothetical protein